MEGSSGTGNSRYALRSKKIQTQNLKRISEGEDLETSTSQKRAKETEAVSVKKEDYDTLFRGPNRAPVKNSNFEAQCRECVETALKHLNKSKKAKKVGGYELMEIRDVCTFMRGMEGVWHHANFKAKPKNAPDAESKVFFAELNYRYPGPLKCVKCCILGHLDFGSWGCTACEKFYPKLRHPQHGFHIGYLPYVLPGIAPNKESGSA